METHGVVNVFKPAGYLSAKYAYRLRPIFGQRRVGHAGTLDPCAEGVVVCCLGKATRLVPRLMDLTKTYEVTLRLGVTNACFDEEMPAEPVAGAELPSPELIRSTLRRFVGEIQQSPPAFSAVKIGGMPSYERARRGQAVTTVLRSVRIDQIAVLSHEADLLRLRVVCGKGTYIRSLARDLGEAWGCGAICAALRRTCVGPFAVENAVDLAKSSPDEVKTRLLSVEQVRAMLDEHTRTGRPSAASAG